MANSTASTRRVIEELTVVEANFLELSKPKPSVNAKAMYGVLPSCSDNSGRFTSIVLPRHIITRFT